MKNIQCLFLDIGGVVLTDGWNTRSRDRAAKRFHLDRQEFEEAHH